MKVIRKRTVTEPLDVASVRMELPVRYGTEDIPADFPGRAGDLWVGIVDLTDHGAYLRDWPKDRGAFVLDMKVSDSGTYSLHAPEGSILASLVEEYVPHGVIPGRYGDYVVMRIEPDGRISNWPGQMYVNEFWGNDSH